MVLIQSQREERDFLLRHKPPEKVYKVLALILCPVLGIVAAILYARAKSAYRKRDSRYAEREDCFVSVARCSICCGVILFVIPGMLCFAGLLVTGFFFPAIFFW
ncbi:Oidioi.mRNA.OKI2018_I69.PAR.g8691.t1.cds [Oikopleura dioica]|uniref:Oidioi.mRNA.OKI2018_I69.PAR.g8691.t1.cds n=1 Tax=Oikopleura dioica TaxID=34765 RepID=A0ABN7RH79_OIKDI|nr:Oidioi.mRNA.OKI2018_I69.PAR.g8691.t1.cds [Oikopleura dioica]